MGQSNDVGGHGHMVDGTRIEMVRGVPTNDRTGHRPCPEQPTGQGSYYMGGR